MSQLGWIDFSPDDRNKVRNVLALMKEQGTLDELGIGQIRDAYSNLLFPGISTIQTRAKYFITIPRILRDYSALKPAQKKRHKSLQKYLTDQENMVAQILDQIHDEREKGIIGRTRIESGGVDRKPSVIYWNGLRTFGLINTSLSLTDFCRQLEGYEIQSDLRQVEHREGIDDHDTNDIRRLISLPKYDQNWMDEDNLSLELTQLEAEFLKGKIVERNVIMSCVPAQLFKHDLVEQVLSENVNSGVDAFDVLAEILNEDSVVDAQCKNNLELAKEFSLAMEGPHLRYNLLLAQNNGYDHRVKEYQDDYSVWLEKVRSINLFQAGCADRWLTTAVNDDKHSIKQVSQQFVRDCCELLAKQNSKKQLDILVAKQADRNKGPRSLLKRKLSHDGWMGIRRLDYRWSSARVIVQDIQEGLHASA